jgi:hypothetical protein
MLVLCLQNDESHQRTSIAPNVDQEELGIFANGQCKCQHSVFTWPDHHVEIAHKITRQEKGCRHPAIADILFDVRFAIKMRHVAKTTLANLRNVQKRREDEVLDSGLLRDICDVLALRLLDVGIGSLPVVGD